MKQTQQQIENLRTLQEQLDSALHETAQENTLLAESAAIQEKIDNIKLPEIDTTELAKQATLNEVSSKLDNINVEVDLSAVAKQETLETQGGKIDRILDIVDERYANEINDILGV